MKTKITVINVQKEFGLEENKAKEIEALYFPMIKAINEFEPDFNKIVSQEPSIELMPIARELRLKIAKMRVLADKARKGAKEEFLRANKAIQGAYNTFEYAVKSKEEKLLAIEKYAENLELERIAKLQKQRLSEIIQFVDENAILPELGNMSEEVWNGFLIGTKKTYNDKIKAEKEAERQRIEAEEAERQRIAEIERENKRLAEEVKEKERLAQIERKKREEEEKLRIKKENKEKQRLAKIEAEKEKQRQIEKQKQAEILRKEKQEKEKIEKELRERKEAEILAEKKIKEAENKLKNAPDKEKLNKLAKDLELFELPILSNVDGIKILENVKILISKITKYIKEQSNNI